MALQAHTQHRAWCPHGGRRAFNWHLRSVGPPAPTTHQAHLPGPLVSPHTRSSNLALRWRTCRHQRGLVQNTENTVASHSHTPHPSLLRTELFVRGSPLAAPICNGSLFNERLRIVVGHQLRRPLRASGKVTGATPNKQRRTGWACLCGLGSRRACARAVEDRQRRRWALRLRTTGRQACVHLADHTERQCASCWPWAS